MSLAKAGRSRGITLTIGTAQERSKVVKKILAWLLALALAAIGVVSVVLGVFGAFAWWFWMLSDTIIAASGSWLVVAFATLWLCRATARSSWMRRP